MTLPEKSRGYPCSQHAVRRALTLATWGTLVEEIALGTLIWVYEFRPYVMLTGIILHLVFEFVLNLQFFGWIMIAGLLLFTDPKTIEAWF